MSDEISDWPNALQSVIDKTNGPLTRVSVARAVDSTQDEARRIGARPGDVIVAARQTAGRGRMGRAWADTRDGGIAVTFVVPAERGGRLAIAGAIAAAHAAEALLQRGVGIKWPNDILVDERKLAGVLVEQADEIALVGIGMNVTQTDWAPDGPSVAARAVSLRELGSTCTRLDALKSLIAAANTAILLNDPYLAAQFAARDVVVGKEATLCTPDGEIAGTVLELDPLHGLLVRNARGTQWLDGATTTLIRVNRDAASPTIRARDGE